MAENEEKTNDLDFNKFKEEIVQTNKGMMDELKESIMQTVQSTLTEHAETLKSVPAKRIEAVSDEAIQEFAEEIEELGVDEKQGSALVKLMKKVLNKQTSNFEDSVLKKVDENINAKESAKEITNEIVMMFPEIKDRTSALFKESKKIFAQMSKKAQQAPEAEAIAVERAALRLGVKPRSLAEANAWASQNPLGGESGNAKAKKKEFSADLAKFFNVDPKKVNEKLRQKGLL